MTLATLINTVHPTLEQLLSAKQQQPGGFQPPGFAPPPHGAGAGPGRPPAPSGPMYPPRGPQPIMHGPPLPGTYMLNVYVHSAESSAQHSTTSVTRCNL